MAQLNFIILDVSKPLCDSAISLIGNQRIILSLQSVVQTEFNNACVVLLKAQEKNRYEGEVLFDAQQQNYTTATTSTIAIDTTNADDGTNTTTAATITTTKYFVKLQLKMNKDPIHVPTR